MDNIIELSDCSNVSTWTNEHYNVLHYVCSKTKLSKKHAIEGLLFYKGDYKTLIRHVSENKTIDMVVNQTDIPREEVIEKLRQNNGNSISVIREYLGTASTIESNDKSTNQQIFSEMRTFMDTIKTQYDRRKGINNKNKIINEYIKK